MDRDHAEIGIRRQCELLGTNRSGLYYAPLGESEENPRLMRMLDEQYTRTPFYGSRRMVEWLATRGFEVNRKRVRRLMEVMGIEAVYPKPKLSVPGDGRKIYPYLLRDVEVTRLNQVWSTDITYIRMARGFVYPVAVMDWFSRYVLSWRLSPTLELDFYVEALKCALRGGVSRKYLTPIKDRSSRVKSSPVNWRTGKTASAWTDEVDAWTTFSSSGCGGRSNTGRCT